MEWTEESIVKLRSLWDEGLSTAEIGRRMSVSKNAIVGKAHRLNLPARPSPIRRAAGERPAAPKRIGPRAPLSVQAQAAAPQLSAERLPALLPAPLPVEARRPAPVIAGSRPSAAQEERTVSPLRAVPAPRADGPRTSPCCWPLGEPGTPSFRFCDAAALSGKPYCAEHAQVAYVKVRERREDAA